MVFEYEHPDKRSGTDVYNQQLVKWLIVKGFITKDKNAKILDLASGRGYFYFALKKMGYKNVFANDLCPVFKECKKGDINKGLPYKKDYFDVIISRDIAEHMSNSERFFEEQHRLLKNGGVIIVMTPNAEHMSLGEFFTDYTHVRPYTRKSLSEALRMHGFNQIHVTRLRAIPRLWLFTTKAFDYLFSRTKNNLLGVAKKARKK